MKVSYVFFAIACWMGSVPVAIGQQTGHPIQIALDAGNIEEAEKLLPTIPSEADTWLGKIALAQLERGDRSGAKQSLRRIHNSGELAQATQAVAQQARGGATGADFDSLINLITSTVEPDTWDDVGGPGTVQSFPGGVAVDAAGVLRKKMLKKSGRSLDLIRNVSTIRTAQGDPKRTSKLRMVSLPRLERELILRVAVGESPTDVMKHLAGIYEVRYLFLFPETNDVVIAGPAAAWSTDEQGRSVTDNGRPVLLLDDLVTLLRNARDQQGQFGCSIDPKRDALVATKAFLGRPTGPLKPSQTKRWVNKIRETLGHQDIKVYGIDSRSHVASVLVEADYHMKLVGMGLEPSVDGLESYLDSISGKSIPKSMDVLRWWFTLKPDSIVQNEQGTAFECTSEAVRLQCENERLSDAGERSHTGDTSELNQAFAHRFTHHYAQLCREYSLYAELDNLFRLALVAGVLQRSDIQSQLDWDTDWLINSVKSAVGPAATEVPSIVNHRVINRRHVVVGVSGGVTVNVANHVRKLKKQETAATASVISRAAKNLAPTSDVWWWD